MSLPNPGMDAIPFTELKAEFLDDMIENIEALAEGHGLDNGVITNVKLAPGIATPVGVVTQFAGTNAPVGWLMCTGSAVSRVTYAALFAVIGTTYGDGDGSTTFNLPNFTGRVPVGQDGSQTEFNSLGKQGGHKAMQSHNHTGTTSTNGNHTHGFTRDVVHTSASTSSRAGSPGGQQVGWGGAGLSTAGNHNHSFTTSTSGSGNAGNLQPYIVTNYLIKT